MAKLKPMKDEKELAAVPTDQPVLVVLEPPVSSAESEGVRETQDNRTGSERQDETGAEDGAKQLKQQLEASETARAKAEKVASEARALVSQRETELREARAQTADSESDAVASGLAAAQAEVGAAKTAYKVAFEAGDGDGMANANEKIGRAAADIREFERAGATLADRKERDDKTAKDAPTVPPKQAADINEVIDQMQLLPAERVWLKAHPDALMDRSRNVELDAAYIRATRKGLVRGTPKYFEFIETDMDYAEAGEPENTETERTTIVAAPVSREARSSITGQTNSGNRVILTPEQREFARTMGLSDVKYAEQVLALQKDKKLNTEKYAARG